MTIPKPKKKEKRTKFMSRCLKNKNMKIEFVDIKQRFAVCSQSWRSK